MEIREHHETVAKIPVLPEPSITLQIYLSPAVYVPFHYPLQVRLSSLSILGIFAPLQTHLRDVISMPDQILSEAKILLFDGLLGNIRQAKSRNNSWKDG